jgi:glycogen synthase
VIHVHGYHTLLSLEMIYLIKKIDFKIPIIFTAHYDPLNRSTIVGKLFGGLYNLFVGKKLFKKVDHIISISNFESKNIKKIYNSEISVIPHGVNNIQITEREKYGIIKLLYVGYLMDYKGVQDIIKAVNRLVNLEKVENLKLTVIGEGPYKKNLLKLSNKLKVENFIEWKHFMAHDKIIEEMHKHNIFILLSKTEGYGIVVAEALSQGIPSIVTKRTALEEFTGEIGCFGVNCPPDPKEVSDLIMKIYNSNIKVGPFSEKIRTWDKVSEDHENIYKKVLLGDDS